MRQNNTEREIEMTIVCVTLEKVECCSCSLVFGLTTDFVKRRRNDHRTFYCPGCRTSQRWDQESIVEREKRLRKNTETQLQRERASHDQTKASLTTAKLQRSAAKGQLTKVKNRVGKGVCPCCNRTFANLQRHMTGQHPDFAATE